MVTMRPYHVYIHHVVVEPRSHAIYQEPKRKGRSAQLHGRCAYGLLYYSEMFLEDLVR